MIHISDKTKNKIDKRVIYLKKFPGDEEIQKIVNDKKAKDRIAWKQLKNIQYTRMGNQIIISKEQAEQSSVLNISHFIGQMETISNIFKIQYTVYNNDLNFKATVWYDSILAKKLGYPFVINSVALIEDQISGKRFYSFNGDDDGTYTVVNGVAFPTCCVVNDASWLITFLDANGKLPPPEEFYLKEMNLDLDIITEQREKKPETNYTNEVKVTRNNYEPVYIPVADFDFDEEAQGHVRSFLIFDEASDFSTINLKDDNAPFLAVAKDHELFSIGIFDEENSLIYYYNNGDTSGEYTELHGETYPNYMITKDIKLVLSVFKYFIENGKPYDKVQWIKEEI